MQNDTCFDPDRCPVERTLEVIGGRWKPLILYHVRGSSRRFNELRRLIPGVTQRMLTQHLRELEADGVLRRDVREKVPPHVDYSLTDLGRSLLPILDAMAAWGHARPDAPGRKAKAERSDRTPAPPSTTPRRRLVATPKRFMPTQRIAGLQK